MSMQVEPVPAKNSGITFFIMGKIEEKHRKVYREVFGIKWDGRMYNIHHINGNHDDNTQDNLILLPQALHRRFHAIFRQARLDWNKPIRDFVLEAYFNGADGVYLNNMEWFQIYSEIVQELAFWGKMKMQRYRSELTGDLLPIEGIIAI